MKLCLLLVILFFNASLCYSQSPIKVEAPKTSNIDSARRNIVVSIDAKQNYFLGTKEIKAEQLDSVLNNEIHKLKLQSYSPVVIINADTSALYGKVFKVVQLAKKDSARVFFNVKQ